MWLDTLQTAISVLTVNNKAFCYDLIQPVWNENIIAFHIEGNAWIYVDYINKCIIDR